METRLSSQALGPTRTFSGYNVCIDKRIQYRSNGPGLRIAQEEIACWNTAMTVVACCDHIGRSCHCCRCPHRRYPNWDRLGTLIKQQPVNIRFINHGYRKDLTRNNSGIASRAPTSWAETTATVLEIDEDNGYNILL